MLELTKAMGVLGVTAYSYDDLLGAHSQTCVVEQMALTLVGLLRSLRLTPGTPRKLIEQTRKPTWYSQIAPLQFSLTVEVTVERPQAKHWISLYTLPVPVAGRKDLLLGVPYYGSLHSSLKK